MAVSFAMCRMGERAPLRAGELAHGTMARLRGTIASGAGATASVPPWRVFSAVGQGSLFLGLHHGFRALVEAGVRNLPLYLIVVPSIDTGTVTAPLRGEAGVVER